MIDENKSHLSVELAIAKDTHSGSGDWFTILLALPYETPEDRIEKDAITEFYKQSNTRDEIAHLWLYSFEYITI